jgi:hypothetical protein
MLESDEPPVGARCFLILRSNGREVRDMVTGTANSISDSCPYSLLISGLSNISGVLMIARLSIKRGLGST